ncbi:alkaline phosphatase [Candidatus Methylocalor cossyra]|uniref:Alkaline phosphatase n=1 Tax=Candidatus Methylocalor cossyra TaxID=3108543 RepID=A0ABM9NLT7_9GAMM
MRAQHPPSKRHLLSLAVAALLGSGVQPAAAGPDDDAAYFSDLSKRNSIDPVVNGGLLSDNPTNAEPTTGLRIMPPTDTLLIAGQRFDLRVETQIPAKTAPSLSKLTVNGKDITKAFNDKINTQGSGLESGTPAANTLYGATARNLYFAKPGTYTVEATVTVDGSPYTIKNTYRVADSPLKTKPKLKHVVFFLGDAMGLPIRSAARIYSKRIVEGRTQGKLNMDLMDEYGLVQTASFDSVITDSAPGMANYVTGMKQANNALNVSVDNTPENSLDNPRIETLWEFMKRVHGWKTGVVTDAFVTDATPAAEAAHTRARSNRTAIAQQFLDYYEDGTAQPKTGYAALAELTQPLDVIIGGGARDWILDANAAKAGTPCNGPTPGDKNQLNTFYQYSSTVGCSGGKATVVGRTDKDLFEYARTQGYTVVRNLDELNAAPDDKPLLGIFTGEFRPAAGALGTDNIPGVLDRLVARGQATIRGKTAGDPEIAQNVAPPQGTDCGALISDCFKKVPSKLESVQKAVKVLNTLAGKNGGWILMVEQSQIDKLAHPLEYERVVYEALELDGTLGWVLQNVAKDRRTLTLVSADHAQPETIIGVTLPSSIAAGGATQAGGCFTTNTVGGKPAYPITLGTSADANRPCLLQDAIGTFNDGTFPTYTDANQDGFPDDPDPTVKLMIEDGGRPTYSQDFLTNYQPLDPAAAVSPALPNPNRDPNGLLMTGNMPTKPVVGSAAKTENSSVAPHSGEDVPLSASGPGAELFGGVYENSDVHARIAAVLKGTKSIKQADDRQDLPGVNRVPSGNFLAGW